MQTRILQVIPGGYQVFFGPDGIATSLKDLSRVPGLSTYPSKAQALQAWADEYKAPRATADKSGRITPNYEEA